MKKLLLFIFIISITTGSLSLTYATDCPNATVIPTVPAMPYTRHLICGSSDDIRADNVTAGCGSYNYYGGQEALFVWTPSASYTDVTIAYTGVFWSGIMVYEGCPTNGGICVGSIQSNTTSKTLTVPVTLTKGTTYYIMFDTWPTPNSPCPGSFTLDGIPILPPAPPTPTQDLSTPTCALGSEIDVSGTLGAYMNWFWQSSDNDTSMNTPYTGAHTVFANGTYYIRTYDSSTTQWSASSPSVTISNFPVAPVSPPAAVAAASPACLNTTISVNSTSTDYIYYWQGTNDGGSDKSQNTSTPYSVSETGTYYVRAFEIATGCWSNSVGTAVEISTYHPVPPTTTTTTYTICNGVTSTLLTVTPIPGGSGGSINESFGTNLISTGSGNAQFDITIPPVPADAVITMAELQLTNASAINGSWRSEIRVALSGAYTLAPTQLSAMTGSGTISPDPFIQLPNFYTAGGTLSLLISETYDDGGIDDAMIGEVRLVVTYTQNPASTVIWYDAATSGSVLGTDPSIEAVGTSILSNTNDGGDYVFYAASKAVCESSSRLAVTVHVTELAVTTSGTTIQATASGASYQWLNCNDHTILPEETYQSFTPTSTGDYAVIIAELGCEDTSVCTTITVLGTSVLGNISEGAFSISPNPASSSIVLELDSELLQTTKTGSIYNSLGRLVSTFPIVAAKTEINTNSLSKGVYIVKLETTKGDVFKKIIKE